MVKQYFEGYFEKGAWHKGRYYEPSMLLKESDIFDAPHSKPITPGQIIGYTNEQLETVSAVSGTSHQHSPCSCTWCEHHPESINTPSSALLTMGILIMIIALICFAIMIVGSL